MSLVVLDKKLCVSESLLMVGLRFFCRDYSHKNLLGHGTSCSLLGQWHNILEDFPRLEALGISSRFLKMLLPIYQTAGITLQKT